MESFKRRPANHFQAAQRNFVLRWHAVFRRRRRLHRAAVDGSRLCIRRRETRSAPARERGNENHFSHPDLDHLSRAGRRTRPPIRPGRDSLGALRRRKKWRCWARSWWPTTNPAPPCCLKRNPNYWKTDAQGRKLPYLDSVRLDIQANRDVEMLRFKRGEIDLINSLDSEYFDKLAATSPQLVHDAGPRSTASRCGSTKSPSLRCRLQEKLVPLGEFPAGDLPGDQSRRPGPGGFSRTRASRRRTGFPGKQILVQRQLKPETYSPDAALKALQGDGFRMENGALKDKDGNAVVFSIITNAGNKSRERMATHDSGRPAEDRHPGQRGHARLPFPDRAHDADLRLRSDPARTHQCGPRPQRADECVAEFVGESSVESVGKVSGNGVGSRDRPPDAGAGFFCRRQEDGKKVSTACRRLRSSRLHLFIW